MVLPNQADLPAVAGGLGKVVVGPAAKAVGDLNRITLDPLNLGLDETKLKGNLSVENFAAPAIRFNLKVDAIDADRYLPPAKDGDAQPAATPGAAAMLVPVDTLRGLDVDGVLEVGRLKQSSGAAVYDRWLTEHARGFDVEVADVTEELSALGIAGPRSRALLEAASGRSLDALRFMRATAVEIGRVPCTVLRVSYTGELGYELYCRPHHLRALYQCLMTAPDAEAPGLIAGC